MQIRDIKCYLLQGEPATRQESCGARGSIAPVPPGISGLLTHDQGFGADPPDGFTFSGEEPEPTYRLMIRLVTDGELDAYADYATGFDPRELEWQAKAFLARYAHMLIGVDAFRPGIHLAAVLDGPAVHVHGEGAARHHRPDVVGLGESICPPADLQSCSEPAAKVSPPTATSAVGPLTIWWPTR